MLKSGVKKCTGQLTRTGERIDAHSDVVEKPERKRRLGRHRCRWEDNIKIAIQEIGWRLWSELLLWLKRGTSGWLL